MVSIISKTGFQTHFSNKNDRLVLSKIGKYLISCFCPGVQLSQRCPVPGNGFLGQDFSFFYRCLEKSVCYFIKMFKADPLMTLFPTHINIIFPNTLCEDIWNRVYNSKVDHIHRPQVKVVMVKTSWKSNVSEDKRVALFQNYQKKPYRKS